MMKILEDLPLNTTTSSKVEAINLLSLLLNQAILSLRQVILKIRIIRTVRIEVIKYNIPSLKNNRLLKLNHKDNSKPKHRLSTNFDTELLRIIEKKETLSMQRSCITVILMDLTTTLFSNT
uniref:Uncharacterized protein n=1 Tax=Myoviridae sp. ctBtT5 TaxID=2825048 RepID=A0A8S5PZA9_9CAUD|nr:MAG TPA: hypothetical protein [Myoviridae sp. ctBtT5]